MSRVRIEAADDDVFISSLCFPGNRGSWREKQKPAGESSGFQKNGVQSTRSEIPPGQNDMPRNALQRGGDNHQPGRFNEHFNGILC
jgi:hypothetical protein